MCAILLPYFFSIELCFLFYGRTSWEERLGRRGTGPLVFHEIAKEGPIVDKGLAQFFRLGAAAPVVFGDATRCSVVGDYLRVVDGQIGRGLLEIGYRVPAFFHHLTNELIRFLDRATGVIDEAALHLGPTFLVRAAVMHG